MKTQTKIIVLVSAILILFLSIRSCAKKDAVASKATEKVKTYVSIQPPLPGIDVPIQKFEINPKVPSFLFL